MLVMAIVLMICSTFLQRCNNDSYVNNTNAIIDSLNCDNQSLLIDIENIEKGIAERDSVISVLQEKVKLTNKVVYIYKQKRNEEINYISNLVPDSLYSLLSRL